MADGQRGIRTEKAATDAKEDPDVDHEAEAKGHRDI